LRGFENRVLKKMSGREREGGGGERENCLMTKFMVCTLHKVLFFLMAQQPPVAWSLVSIEA
jgi:hypothetical protein